MTDPQYPKMLKRDLVAEVERLSEQSSVLREGYEAATAALLSIQSEDVGWAPLNSLQQHDGYSIENLHLLYAKMKEATKGNPLLKRGFTLRSSYVWGRGLDIDGVIPPRFQKKIDKNEDVLFTQSAFIANERSLYNAGQHFMFYDTGKDEAYPVSFSEITNFASNPNRISDVWYYQRTWCEVDPKTNLPSKEPTIQWYPVAETRERSGSLLATINEQPVNKRVVVIDVRVNRDEDEVWGVPDVLPAYPYAWAHSEYLKDGSRLLKALSTIAWKVVSKSKGNGAAAAIKMGGSRGAGATASMTADTDLVSMPKSGQVDLGDGDRIASYVAAALGVSLTALLSTAGAAGGSFGAEASLDVPAQNDALSRQAIWENYYRRILRVMGIKDDANVNVRFRNISEDPAFRTLQGLNLLLGNGGITQEEYRKHSLELMDVKPLTEELPKPNAFTGAKTIKPDYPSDIQLKIAELQIGSTEKLADKAAKNQLKLADKNNAAQAAKPAAAPTPAGTPTAKKPNNAADATPKRGVSGNSGKLSDGDNSARDATHKPGTGNN